MEGGNGTMLSLPANKVPGSDGLAPAGGSHKQGYGKADGMNHPELLRLRDSIDNIDAALLHLLAERFKCTQAVGEFKAAHGLPPADPAREASQIARLRRLAEEARLDPDFAEKFLNFIVKEVIRHHEAIVRNKSGLS
jgi:chorismate mutase